MYLNDKICVISATNSVTDDNKVIDYIQLASVAADRVRYYLDIPTVLITADSFIEKKNSNFAEVIFAEPKKITKRNVIAGSDTLQYQWLNDFRVDAYELTKGMAKRILMIDADYMIGSDQLLAWVRNDYPFLILDDVYDVTGSSLYRNKNMPSNDIPQRWATVISWNQSEESKVIFDTARMVRDNYAFYALIFGFPKSPFRNDLAFSVACHLHNVPKTHAKLFNLAPGGYVYQTKDKSGWIVDFNDKLIRWNTDIHVLNKQYAIDPSMLDLLRLKNVKA
jgi:hypothetical protein